MINKIIQAMETPRKVLEDVEREIKELRLKIEDLEQKGKTELPEVLNMQFAKLVDYLYFRLKQLIKYRNTLE
jgi:hypothetical protein|tara:strand:+ start:6466 stop:6681 length:216 start_codon:yes stop_codon:yes gene_type:complete